MAKRTLRDQSLNYDTNAAGDESGISCPEPTLTQQQFKEESDINFIADRYGLNGELPTIGELPTYGDFTGVFDYQSAHNAVIKAREQFMTLPAKVRSRFNNDPQAMLDFIEDPENREEARVIFKGLLREPDVMPQSPPGQPGGGGRVENPTTLSKPAGEPPIQSTGQPDKPASKDT